MFAISAIFMHVCVYVCVCACACVCVCVCVCVVRVCVCGVCVCMCVCVCVCVCVCDSLHNWFVYRFLLCFYASSFSLLGLLCKLSISLVTLCEGARLVFTISCNFSLRNW